MSETKTVVGFELASKWRTMDSVTWDDDSLQDSERQSRHVSKDSVSSFDLAMNMSNISNDEFGDENDTLNNPQQEQQSLLHHEQHPLLQSPEKEPKDHFPDTPNHPSLLAGWNLTTQPPSFPSTAISSSDNNQASPTTGMKTAASAAELLDQIEGPVSSIA